MDANFAFYISPFLFSVSRSRLYCDRMVTERFKYLLRDHCELCAAKFKTIKEIINDKDKGQISRLTVTVIWSEIDYEMHQRVEI